MTHRTILGGNHALAPIFLSQELMGEVAVWLERKLGGRTLVGLARSTCVSSIYASPQRETWREIVVLLSLCIVCG